MSVLQERWLHPSQSSHQAMREAGGLWVAMGRPDPAELVAEARERSVRALEVQQNDIAVLAQLPELEFLYVASDPTDLSPLYRLPNLRLLAFTGTWDGELDFTAFPRLQWFDAVECPRDGGGLPSLFVGHERLHTLGIGRYPWPDLAPLGALRLRRLAIWSSRKLSALDGAEALADSVRDLSLSSLPNLTSLAGLGLLPDLEVLSLQSLRHITTVEWVRDLPRLRYLDIMDLKGVETLTPLASHSALECVMFGRTGDLDLSPLETLPRLRLINTGTYRWNRDLHAFPYLHDLGSDHPLVREYQGLAVG